jgi:ubiquinone/menaquinone biosynthesis C-methylase UbiE
VRGQALALCRSLPRAPAVLDLGCGAGAQTLHLAELTAGSIIAVDSHAPWITQLEQTIAEHGLADRVRPIQADMASLPYDPESSDLIWSEGALYNVGIEPALRICRRLLRPGGYLAFTDAVWRRASPPAEVLAVFERDYPEMGWVGDILTTIEPEGWLTVVGVVGDVDYGRDMVSQGRIPEAQLYVPYGRLPTTSVTVAAFGSQPLTAS